MILLCVLATTQASDRFVRYEFFNPIALRKAKIVCNFGLSERNRVKEDPIWAQSIESTLNQNRLNVLTLNQC